MIDGRVQFVGNNLDDVRQKIAGEAKQAKPAQVSLKWSGSDQLHVAVRSDSAEGQNLAGRNRGRAEYGRR